MENGYTNSTHTISRRYVTTTTYGKRNHGAITHCWQLIDLSVLHGIDSMDELIESVWNARPQET